MPTIAIALPRARTLALILFSCAALLLAACDDGGGSSGDPDAVTDTTGGGDTTAPDTVDDTGTADTTTTPDTAEDTTPPPPECTTNDECTDPAAPLCDTATGACVALPPGHPLGWGDGSVESVDFVAIYTATNSRQAVDLEFNPVRPEELWVQLREVASDQACDSNVQTAAGCNALMGSVLIITDAPSESRSVEWKMDPNAWHFMRRPPALAFGPNDTFATCGEERTGNFLDEFADFIGPTLWSSDPTMFAVEPPGGNGSHLDMLHQTPWCMGIAHEAENVYWLFNGDNGALDRYDFNEDHGPGAADHSDGEVWRFATGTVSRVPGVPSHMAFDVPTQSLYVADTGNGRIVRLDASTGTMSGNISPVYEPMQTAVIMDGAVVEDVVAAGGTLQRPSGLALHTDGLLYVSDNATSLIHAFDLEGNLVRSLDTGLPEGSVAGLTFGPDGKLYFTDLLGGDVWRIDPR